MNEPETPFVRHPGGPNGVKDRQQYAALLEAVGNWKAARSLMEIIKWASSPVPTDTPYILDRWEHEWTEGRIKVTDIEVKRMRQRLMANTEWRNRLAGIALAEATKALAEQAKDGTLAIAKNPLIKYLADGLAMVTRDTSQAFGTPKPTDGMRRAMRVKSKIKAPVEPKQLPEAAPINAEFRVVEEQHADS